VSVLIAATEVSLAREAVGLAPGKAGGECEGAEQGLEGRDARERGKGSE